ncbi:hypothetical protein JTB14_033135 [Gonioctena quinquepunctata]|nr:hypothetical protein JTB14_033135 [Gonioctena quinquepunctata]
MYPLSRYLDQSLGKWLNNNPGRTVSVFQIGKFFCEAYLKSSTSENAINAFKKAGIVPFDINLFTDLDFAPAEVSENDDSVPNVAEHIPRIDANTAQPTPGTSRDVQSHPIPETDATT